jgi:predicted enzyme related to lactoylglutathione lyase
MTVVDHIIIAVEDLAQATHDYGLMLGRQPSWQGTHPEYGSANTIFRVENTYVELLAATGQGLAGSMIAKHIETMGEGLSGLIFGTDDLDGFIANASAKGLAMSAPEKGFGEDPHTGQKRSWRNVMWDNQAARGIFSFAIQHDDPEALKMAEVDGSGHFTAVDHIVVQTKDAAAAKTFYGEQMGVRLALEQSRPDWGGDMLFFRCNHMSIEVIASDKHPSEQDSLWGLAYKTDDIDAAYHRMQAAGIEVSEVREGRKPKTRVCTVKTHCANVPTLLIEHTA